MLLAANEALFANIRAADTHASAFAGSAAPSEAIAKAIPLCARIPLQHVQLQKIPVFQP